MIYLLLINLPDFVDIHSDIRCLMKYGQTHSGGIVVTQFEIQILLADVVGYILNVVVSHFYG